MKILEAAARSQNFLGNRRQKNFRSVACDMQENGEDTLII
jgi:hypothetical protein